MGDVVNLRQARKARQRAEREAAASLNRQAFGRSKAERRETDLRTTLADRALEAHRRETPVDDA